VCQAWTVNVVRPALLALLVYAALLVPVALLVRWALKEQQAQQAERALRDHRAIPCLDHPVQWGPRALPG
jgi:hypothetical protein